MPYEDEDPLYGRIDPAAPELNALTRQIIGAAMEVHRRLGPGLDEALYQAAMCIELRLCGLSFAPQVEVDVEYKGQQIGKRRLDLIVEGKVVVELKAVEQLTPLFKAQARTYLRITGLRLALLINFNVAVLKDGIKRIIEG